MTICNDKQVAWVQLTIYADEVSLPHTKAKITFINEPNTSTAIANAMMVYTGMFQEKFLSFFA